VRGWLTHCTPRGSVGGQPAPEGDHPDTAHVVADCPGAAILQRVAAGNDELARARRWPDLAGGGRWRYAAAANDGPSSAALGTSRGVLPGSSSPAVWACRGRHSRARNPAPPGEVGQRRARAVHRSSGGNTLQRSRPPRGRWATRAPCRMIASGRRLTADGTPCVAGGSAPGALAQQRPHRAGVADQVRRHLGVVIPSGSPGRPPRPQSPSAASSRPCPPGSDLVYRAGESPAHSPACDRDSFGACRMQRQLRSRFACSRRHAPELAAAPAVADARHPFRDRHA